MASFPSLSPAMVHGHPRLGKPPARDSLLPERFSRHGRDRMQVKAPGAGHGSGLGTELSPMRRPRARDGHAFDKRLRSVGARRADSMAKPDARVFDNHLVRRRVLQEAEADCATTSSDSEAESSVPGRSAGHAGSADKRRPSKARRRPIDLNNPKDIRRLRRSVLQGSKRSVMNEATASLSALPAPGLPAPGAGLSSRLATKVLPRSMQKRGPLVESRLEEACREKHKHDDPASVLQAAAASRRLREKAQGSEPIAKQLKHLTPHPSPFAGGKLNTADPLSMTGGFRPSHSTRASSSSESHPQQTCTNLQVQAQRDAAVPYLASSSLLAQPSDGVADGHEDPHARPAHSGARPVDAVVTGPIR